MLGVATKIDLIAVREMSHEVVQRVSEWREKNRQIIARSSDIREDLERQMAKSSLCRDSYLNGGN